MVTDCQHEGLADLFTEVKVLALAVEIETGINISHDVWVVPEEVAGESLLEEGGVAENAEELPQALEIFGDVAAVLHSARQVNKDKLLDLIDAIK